MDRDQLDALRELLAPTQWLMRSRSFASSLRTAGHREGGLLIVGTPTVEPWHFTAHLADEARWSGVPHLSPTLVRWDPPPQAPPHLAVGLSRLEQAAKGETVFVVAPDAAPDALLERVADARRDGAVVLSMDSDDANLHGLAHDVLSVPQDDPVNFEIISHLVTAAAGDPGAGSGRGRGGRGRLAALLDTIAGVRR
ncbi:MAG: hypothetical protein JWM93_3425 [Frankiales bacterium]|nr:hypothetical protein [Frankiales bacterium]